MTGDTISVDFPTTPGAFQPTRQGKADAFVTTLNTTGSALLYSTYLGGVDQGAGREGGNGIAVDTACHIYVTGVTRSDNFPLLPLPPATLQPASGGGGDDGFVTKFSAEACPPARISLQSVVTPPLYTIGGPVTYRYTLRNESNVTLRNPRVDDNRVTGVMCGSFTGTPATAVCTGTYIIKDADVDASRMLTNTARGFATVEPGGPELSSNLARVSLPVVLAGELGISKSATPDPVLAGQEITFTLTAVNDAGDVDLIVTDVIPDTTTFVRAEAPAGWRVSTSPPVGETGPVEFRHGRPAPLPRH